MTSEERFARIESILDRFAAGMDELRGGQKDLQRNMDQLREGQQDLRTAHVELEAAQLNQQKTHTRLEEALASFIDETRERITNLTILVDRLVERDLGRSGGGI